MEEQNGAGKRRSSALVLHHLQAFAEAKEVTCRQNLLWRANLLPVKRYNTLYMPELIDWLCRAYLKTSILPRFLEIVSLSRRCGAVMLSHRYSSRLEFSTNCRLNLQKPRFYIGKAVAKIVEGPAAMLPGP